jgi:hypothetical protein
MTDFTLKAQQEGFIDSTAHVRQPVDSTIRLETPADYEAVERLTFQALEHRGTVLLCSFGSVIDIKPASEHRSLFNQGVKHQNGA